jgi:hypothetical protein
MKGDIYGFCVDHKGVGVVKMETKVNLKQSQVLSKCMLLSTVHDTILLCAQYRRT